MSVPNSTAKRALPDPRTVALVIAAVSALTLAGAWAFQWNGYSPCELCLKERIPYYAIVPLALATAWAVRGAHPAFARIGYGLIILLLVAGTALGLYHAGVEWQFWPGPTQCSGAVTAPAKVDDFLQQLNHVAVVRCDQAALHVLGLSLAAWNALICLGLIALANLGLLQTGIGGPSTRNG